MTSNTIKYTDLFKIKGAQHIIVGSSGSGKTYFTTNLINLIQSPKKIYIVCTDEDEWKSSLDDNFEATYITSDPFSTNMLFTLKDAIVVFEDYAQEKKTESLFNKFVNFYVRHNNLCLFLITHSIFKSNLYSKILSCPSIFLTTCSSNLFFSQKYDKMFNTVITKLLKENLKKVSCTQKPVIYVTPTFYINSIEQIIKPGGHETEVKMFKNDKTFFLLDVDQYKFEEPPPLAATKLDEILNDFEEMYPKKFKKIKKFVTSLYNFCKKFKIVEESTMDIVIDKTRLNFYDFVISSQDFSKKSIDPKIKNILQYLRKNNFKVPKFTLHNNSYKTYLT